MSEQEIVDRAGQVRRVAAADPELAARLAIQMLPAAAAGLHGPLACSLEVEGVGSWRVEVDGEGGASVREAAPGDGGEVDFALLTDAGCMARLATGASPLPMILTRRLRIRGSRRKAMRLRRLSADVGIRDVARIGAPIDPDLVFRALPFAIDPAWIDGHGFEVGYELEGEGGGHWFVRVGDGSVSVARQPANGRPDAVAHVSVEDWRRLLAGEVTPAEAVRDGLTEVDGKLYPVTLLGRWIERAEGRDAEELERERRQREMQARRAGAWGSRSRGGAPGMGDPGHDAEGDRRRGGGLLSYGELYALWERQNWRVHELDFEVDKEQWVTTPTEAQRNTAWTLGSFYVGEERVTADLAPFVMAAPSGEVEVFLSTQLVDEARHAAFFDRWAAEVMTLSAEDLRGRLREMESTMLDAWHHVFDERLREVANRIKARPDDLELFVEGIATYHMVIEGVLAMTGQRTILQYLGEHDIYPGFQTGFSLVEQDEHRHIAFGVKFLRDVCAERPEMRSVVERRVLEMVPEAVKVFMPPHADDPADFRSYGYHSSQVYGYAYKALKRRMGVIGIEVPPAEELMPGPIDPEGLPSQQIVVPRYDPL